MKLINAVTQMLEDEKTGIIWPLTELLVEIGLVSSKNDAKRLIAQNGISVYWNNKFEVLTDPSILFHEGEYIFKRGKHQFKKVILKKGE